MYSGRMYFTDKLVGMGARIILCDPYRCLGQGPLNCLARDWKVPISVPAWRGAGRFGRKGQIQNQEYQPDRPRL